MTQLNDPFPDSFDPLIHNMLQGCLTHWGRVTHICVHKLTNIGSDNGLSPDRRQAMIWTNAGILLFRTLGTNFSEILSEIHAFWFRKMHLKMSSANWRPFCLGLNVLNHMDKLCRYLTTSKHDKSNLSLYFWKNNPCCTKIKIHVYLYAAIVS